MVVSLCLSTVFIYLAIDSGHTDHSPASLSHERVKSGQGRVHGERLSQGSIYPIHWSCTLFERCFSRMLFFSLFWNSELLNSHLGCFSAVTLKAAGRKEASDLSPRRVLLSLSLSLQTWGWPRLRYQVTPSCTVVMKLTGCFKSSTGRATHTHHSLICFTLSDVMLIDWIHTDLETMDLH